MPNDDDRLMSFLVKNQIFRYIFLAIASVILLIAFKVFSTESTVATRAGAIASLAALIILNWIIDRRKDLAILEEARQRQQEMDQFLNLFQNSMALIKDGDLTVSLAQLEEFPEFKPLVRTLDYTIQGFTTMLKKIQKTSAEVSTQAHRILETSGEQASGSSEQAAAVAEITSAMEELARTAAQIAENTNHVAYSSEEAEKRASEGMEHMRGNASSLERMNERMSDINENAHQLGEKFQEIDKILALITSIASETHILALNAAIEAAAAGEYGARFSVIASEVRRLSDMSQEAVEEIKKILADFQKSIQSTILATEQGTKEFDKAMAAAFLIQEKLGAIGEKVGQTTRAAKEISLATQQQKTASDQIVETLKDVSAVIRQIAAALQEFNHAAHKLDSLAMEMQLISQNFTIMSERNIKYLAKNTTQMAEIREFRKQNVTPLLEEIVQRHFFIECIFLVDAEGTLATSAVNERLKSRQVTEVLTPGFDCSKRPWYYTVAETRKPYITSMYKSLITEEDCFTISAPIFSTSGDFCGVIGIDINAINWSRIE